MPLGEKIISIVGGLIVCGIFIGVIYILAKKDKQKNEARIKAMTEEQKQFLISAPTEEVTEKNGGMIVKGLVCEIPKRSDKKSSLSIIFYNTYFPNCMNQFSWADQKVSNEDMEKYGIREGSYVDLLISPEGGRVIFK